MTDDDFTELWNRACGFDEPAFGTHRGDEALHVAIVFHGRVMNSGLSDAVDGHGEDEVYPLPRVVEAFDLLGLAGTGEVIRRAHEERLAAQDLGEAEERIDGTYLLDDEALEAAARRTVDRSPDAFAPLH